MENVKKRILAITGAAILFVGAVCCVVFPRKTDTVASAQIFDESTRTFTIALPTYNLARVSGQMTDEYYKTTPIVAIVGNGTFSLARSIDGFTPAIRQASDLVAFGTSSYAHEYNTIFIGQDGAGQDENATIYVVPYSSAFNDIPDDYYPSSVVSHILYGITNQTECVQFDFYVNYSNLDGDTMQGAGFSLRVPCNEFYNYITPYASYTLNGSPTNRYNVYRTDDVLGWSYSSVLPLLDNYNRGYEEGKEMGDALGFSRGYAKGVADAGGSTFTGLISAVIDVPINAFRSLFNFELLGFNMVNFLLSILTLGVVIAIVRLIL